DTPMLRSLTRLGKWPAYALLASAMTFTAIEIADAAPRGNMGSRGSRTQSAPATTNTAPTQAQPIQRSVTQPGAPAATAARPGAAAQAAQAARPSFARNLMTGVAAGLLGAGLFGLLSGAGLFSGLGSLAGFFGLLLQIGLIYLAYRLIRGFFRSRQQPAMAGGPAVQRMQPQADPQAYARAGMGAGAGAATAAPAVAITPQDFNSFQSALATIQTAYGREDIPTLRASLTPEMAAYFEEELDNNRRRGVLNRTGQVELLQGDLSEAWADPDAEYATVAMRYAMPDAMVERGTGRVIEGDLNAPQQFTEVWTFRREPRQAWKLSAIQQVQ
ncbi:MAG: TIM44-like domain-containing protein, partial [Beijerinckiaceae bacterium]